MAASTPDASRTDAGLDPAATCSLPADDLRARLAWIRAEILPRAVLRQTLPDGVAWEFEPAAGLAESLDQLVALESECCSGIVFEHVCGAHSGRPRLEVRGVDPSSPLLAAPGGQAGVSPPLGRRLARALGLGAGASLLVCCVLPIAAAALFGASSTAALTRLDDPLVIAAAALLFGGAGFAWQRRRQPVRERPACGPGC